MSDIVLNIESRIRGLIDDSSPATYAITHPRLLKIINGQMYNVAELAGVGQAWVTGVFSTTDGTADYALPVGTDNEYAQIIALKNATFGRLIEKTDTATIEMYRQSGSTVVIKGLPRYFSVLESTGQVVTVRLYPAPNAVYSIDLLRSLIPSRLAGTVDTVPFDRDLLTALEYRCAARAAKSIAPEERAKRQLTPEYIESLEEDGRLMLQQGIRRIVQLKRAERMTRSNV